MPSNSHKNATFAMVAGLRDVLSGGAEMRVRDQHVREIRNRVTVLERPLDRCIITPKRNNNTFLTIAETFWVLAGRDDLEFLNHYSKNAQSFSDDGVTWHGAYGPRLRSWNKKVDQLKEVKDLLLNETLSRRAVMSLFDPGQDFRIDGKDIPCNNWLHWLIRENALHLNIAVRSNDVMWGFSGINTFEFSVLQEMMALWTAQPVGEASFFASSFHLYDRHYKVAPQIVSSFPGFTCYDFGIQAPKFSTRWDDFDRVLASWLKLEASIRKDPTQAISFDREIPDALLAQALSMLQIYNVHLKDNADKNLKRQLNGLIETDFATAAYEFIGRKQPEVFSEIPQQKIASFFDSYHSGRSPSFNAGISLPELVCSLHRRKDAAYADSWKKRGEQVSILANIARKVDRLGVLARTSTALAEESTLDTAIDLLVYAVKYCLFLLERCPGRAPSFLKSDAPTDYSDHTENFDQFIAGIPFTSGDLSERDPLIQKILSNFEELNEAATSGLEACAKLTMATALCGLAVNLVVTVAAAEPLVVHDMWDRESRG